jgi:hypothetical protein
MANNFSSNVTRKLMMKVLDRFEANRVLSKNVDTQTFNGSFNPNTGDTIDVKRPTDYVSVRSATGDITGNKSDIITGKASATVQDYITVGVDYDEADEALRMGTDDNRFFDDIAARIVVDLETDFGAFMMKNAGLLYGTPGNGVDSWSEIAGASALMKATGVKQNKKWCYALNPHSQVALATEQRSIGADNAFASANDQATVAKNFAGFDVKTATTLASYTTGTGADRAGTVSSNPDVTYATAKDSMTQSVAVTGFQANLVVAAGETVTVTGRNRLNLATRNLVLDATGAPIVFSGVVTETVTLGASGEGTLVIAGPAIYEASGAYNTTDSAVVSGDVVTLGGGADSVIQPNLFWHPDAFTIASVPIKKLHSTDTVGTTKDGLQLRCSKYSNGDANSQTVRFDLRPAYGVMNPFMAGQGHGNP